ncbi:hypothetical protein EVAR_28082_1 [Eumeta japonica]|uniref:Uncharacterized protein n=1 Tax=Eumeta variegata TaxID=151549 RepID=A0A4C1WB05_EUMVA|nr:hypothetical protein EVAR_28082_1 [Eumeta japonica]
MLNYGPGAIPRFDSDHALGSNPGPTPVLDPRSRFCFLSFFQSQCYNTSHGSDLKTLVCDLPVAQLEKLKESSTGREHTPSNIKSTEHVEYHRLDSVKSNGEILSRVEEHGVADTAGGQGAARAQLEVDVPAAGIHKTVHSEHEITTPHPDEHKDMTKVFHGAARLIQSGAATNAQNGHAAVRRAFNADITKEINNNVDHYSAYTGVQYSPLDMAEYVFWTGDERGVTNAIEEFLQEGLMTKEEAITFLQEIKFNIDYLRAHYTQSLRAAEESAQQERLRNMLAEQANAKKWQRDIIATSRKYEHPTRVGGASRRTTCSKKRQSKYYVKYLPPAWFKLELERVAESELKTESGVKLRKEPESKSKVEPGLKLRLGLGSKTSVETKSKPKENYNQYRSPITLQSFPFGNSADIVRSIASKNWQLSNNLTPVIPTLPVITELRPEQMTKRSFDPMLQTNIIGTSDYDRDGTIVSEEEYEEIMEKLKAADTLYTEYTLEEIIYQLAKMMFSQSLTRDPREARAAIQRFMTFLELEAERGQLSRSIEKKVLDVMIAALTDTVGDHPELLQAREGIGSAGTNPGNRLMRQFFEASVAEPSMSRAILSAYKDELLKGAQHKLGYPERN